jgi:hypothetical protein
MVTRKGSNFCWCRHGTLNICCGTYKFSEYSTEISPNWFIYYMLKMKTLSLNFWFYPTDSERWPRSTPLSAKADNDFADKRRSLGRCGSLAELWVILQIACPIRWETGSSSVQRASFVDRELQESSCVISANSSLQTRAETLDVLSVSTRAPVFWILSQAY